MRIIWKPNENEPRNRTIATRILLFSSCKIGERRETEQQTTIRIFFEILAKHKKIRFSYTK